MFTYSTIMVRGKVKHWELNPSPIKRTEIFFHDFYGSLTRPAAATRILKYFCNVQLWNNFEDRSLLSGSSTKCLKNVPKWPSLNLGKETTLYKQDILSYSTLYKNEYSESKNGEDISICEMTCYCLSDVTTRPFYSQRNAVERILNYTYTCIIF